MTATLFTTLAGILMPLLAGIISDYLKSQKSTASAKAEGASESTAAANQESQHALSRMSAANSQPRSGDIVAGRLRDGSY